MCGMGAWMGGWRLARVLQFLCSRLSRVVSISKCTLRSKYLVPSFGNGFEGVALAILGGDQGYCHACGKAVD